MPYRRSFAAAFLVVPTALLMLALSPGGYSAYDDLYYLEAADRWLSDPPFLGTNHWHLRHPLIGSVALSFLMLGRTEFALLVPTMLAYAGTLLVTFRLVSKAVDLETATLATLFAAVTPVFIIYAKIPYPDIIELFLVLLSFSLFWGGVCDQRGLLMLLSGAAIGVSWLVRASCVPIILLYGLLFLAGYKAPRRLYLLLPLGFAPLLLGEWLFYYFTAGDPFYRFAVDAHSLEIPSAHMSGGVADGLRPPFNFELLAKWKPNSIVDVHWLVNPYVDFLTSPTYGPIYMVALIGALLLWLKGARLGPAREFVGILAAMAALWVFVIIYVLNLRPQPRYFGPVTWVSCVVAAIWLRTQLWSRSRALAAALISAVLVIDIALVALRPMSLHTERVLVSYARSERQPLWTSLDRAGFLLQSARLADRVHVGPPSNVPPGGLYVVPAEAISRLNLDGWPQVWRYREEPSLLLRLAPEGALPGGLLARLGGEVTDVVALRRPIGSQAKSSNALEREPSPDCGRLCG